MVRGSSDGGGSAFYVCVLFASRAVRVRAPFGGASTVWSG